MKRKLDKISFDAVAIYKDGSYKTINEYISKWVNDLNGMIRLLEIYLCDYVQNIKIEYYSPDIFELNPDRIISFNYTDTYEKCIQIKEVLLDIIIFMERLLLSTQLKHAIWYWV